MNYEVRYTDTARDDLLRFMEFIERRGGSAAEHAIDTLTRSMDLLAFSPFSCRKAADSDPFLRELIVPFGSTGYVALFEIQGDYVTILALRHQREDDYFH